MQPNAHVHFVEMVCIVWFTTEFLLRFAIYPHRCRFMGCDFKLCLAPIQIFKCARSLPLNIIDFVSVAPFYVELMFVQGFNVRPAAMDNIAGFLLVLRVLRVLRVARIFKLAKYR